MGRRHTNGGEGARGNGRKGQDSYQTRKIEKFNYKWYGDHRGLHRVVRRQRRMYIRDRPGTVYRHLRLSKACLLYTSPSPRDRQKTRMLSSA